MVNTKWPLLSHGSSPPGQATPSPSKAGPFISHLQLLLPRLFLRNVLGQPGGEVILNIPNLNGGPCIRLVPGGAEPVQQEVAVAQLIPAAMADEHFARQLPHCLLQVGLLQVHLILRQGLFHRQLLGDGKGVCPLRPRKAEPWMATSDVELPIHLQAIPDLLRVIIGQLSSGFFSGPRPPQAPTRWCR